MTGKPTELGQAASTFTAMISLLGVSFSNKHWEENCRQIVARAKDIEGKPFLFTVTQTYEPTLLEATILVLRDRSSELYLNAGIYSSVLSYVEARTNWQAIAMTVLDTIMQLNDNDDDSVPYESIYTEPRDYVYDYEAFHAIRSQRGITNECCRKTLYHQ